MYNKECIHFNGYKPCKYQKLNKGLICDKDCKFAQKSGGKILIIKRGAIGEVLRCTPILRKIKKDFPQKEVWWITDFPDIVKNEYVDKILKFTQENIYMLQDVNFDIVYNLDKELICCSLLNKLNSKEKKGFYSKDLKILPIDKDAEYLYKRGIDDNFMRNDKRHYIDEIFEVCGFNFNEEKYIAPDFNIPELVRNGLDQNKKIIGLNTGTSATRTTRLRKDRNWIDVSKKLIELGYEVLLLGGPQEDQKNKIIAEKSGAKYFGVFSLLEYIGIVSLMDIVVTQVTFAMHISTLFGIKTVLMNNIFNKHEYYFYDTPNIILEPDVGCKMCYKSKYDSSCEVKNCMELITVSDILDSITRLLSHEK